MAAFIGSPDIVLLLLQNGAFVDQATMRMETALHLAARNRQIDVARALIHHGATVDAKAKVCHYCHPTFLLSNNYSCVSYSLFPNKSAIDPVCSGSVQSIRNLFVTSMLRCFDPYNKDSHTDEYYTKSSSSV